MLHKGHKYVGLSRVRSLDALVRSGIVKIPKNVPVVVKMDGNLVQGWEPLALAGADSFLKTIRPRVVLAEFAPERIWRAALSAGGMNAKEARYSSADFLKFMESHGYNYTLGQVDEQEMVFVRS